MHLTALDLQAAEPMLHLKRWLHIYHYIFFLFIFLPLTSSSPNVDNLNLDGLMFDRSVLCEVPYFDCCFIFVKYLFYLNVLKFASKFLIQPPVKFTVFPVHHQGKSKSKFLFKKSLNRLGS